MARQVTIYENGAWMVTAYDGGAMYRIGRRYGKSHTVNRWIQGDAAQEFAVDAFTYDGFFKEEAPDIFRRYFATAQAEA